MDLEKPLTQLPRLSLMRSPHPAFPRLPKEAPSVFSLNQPDGGFPHLTEMIHLVFLGSNFSDTKEIFQSLAYTRAMEVEIKVGVIKYYYVLALPKVPESKGE